MAKPDPALLDPARYPFHCRIETRFGDLDTNLHLNNVALVGMLEEGRVRFHRTSGYHAAAAAAGMTSMVASIGIEFLGQSFYPEPLDMHVGAASLGRTSYVLQQLVMQGGRVVTFARSVMVCMGKGSHEGGNAIPIPDSFRQSVQSWMIRE